MLPKFPFSHSSQIYLWKCKSHHMDTSPRLKLLSGFLLNHLHFPVACRVLPGLGLADCSWLTVSTAASSCHLMHTLLLPLKLTHSSHLSPLRFSQAPALMSPFTAQTQHIYHLLRETFLTPLPYPPISLFCSIHFFSLTALITLCFRFFFFNSLFGAPSTMLAAYLGAQ